MVLNDLISKDGKKSNLGPLLIPPRVRQLMHLPTVPTIISHRQQPTIIVAESTQGTITRSTKRKMPSAGQTPEKKSTSSNNNPKSDAAIPQTRQKRRRLVAAYDYEDLEVEAPANTEAHVAVSKPKRRKAPVTAPITDLTISDDKNQAPTNEPILEQREQGNSEGEAEREVVQEQDIDKAATHEEPTATVKEDVLVEDITHKAAS